MTIGNKAINIILVSMLLAAAGEIGLRISQGAQQQREQASWYKTVKSKGEVRILLLGEEAPKEGNNPWSVQLEQIFKNAEQDYGLRFTFINNALVGNHTSAILAQLPDHLRLHEPDIVITNMGINDASSPHLFIVSGQEKVTLPGPLDQILLYRFVKNLVQKLNIHKIMAEQSPDGANQEENSDQYFAGQGRYLDQQGKYNEALEMFEKAQLINPNNDEVYMGMAQVYRHQSHFSQALQNYQKALELNVKNDYAFEGIASAYRGLGQFEKAIEMYQRARTLNNTNYMYYLVPGHMYRERKMYAEAEREYLQGIRENPKDDHTRVWLARLYRDTGRFKEALTILQQLINKRDAFDKETVSANSSVDGYREIIGITPDNYIARIKLARVLSLTGKNEEAQQALNDAISINHIADYPSLADSELSFLYRHTGRIKEAMQSETRILRSGPVVGNYRKIKTQVQQYGALFVAVQYPFRPIETLKQILDYDLRVIYAASDLKLAGAVKNEGYDVYFTDHTFGDFGYRTAKANTLIAQNIANVIFSTLFDAQKGK